MYVSHGIWTSTNEEVTRLLFYIMRVWLEFLFVEKLRKSSAHDEMFSQVEQVILYYFSRYVDDVERDGGIRPLVHTES